MLPKGAFIDCTLETAVSSALPGMTTCVTATDTFGADGNVVLLERGTKLVGETRGEVAQGAPRLFVLWTEARTPTGVVVPLASPGTDELGRSGLSGTIDRHWWLRFGTAILITVIDGAIQGATGSHGNGGTIVLNPSTSSDVTTEVLRGTLKIPHAPHRRCGFADCDRDRVRGRCRWDHDLNALTGGKRCRQEGRFLRDSLARGIRDELRESITPMKVRNRQHLPFPAGSGLQEDLAGSIDANLGHLRARQQGL